MPFRVGVESSEDAGWYRLALVEAGMARLEGAPPVVLLPRSLLLRLPGGACRLQRGTGATLRECSFGRSLIDPLALGAEVVEELGLACAPGARPGYWCARLSPEDCREVCSLIARLEHEARERKPGYERMVPLKLMEAILLLYRCRRQASPRERPTALRIEEVQRFLQDRYADPLTLSGLATRFGFNPSYFSRLFHRQAGMPLVAYINGVRIRRSCVLLKRTSLSVLEIALSVGYNNLSHFNRFFRKLVGMSPREYRAKSEE